MQESDLIITCRIGRQEVLLPINHIYDKILERNLTTVIRFHKKKTPTVNLLKCETPA